MLRILIAVSLSVALLLPLRTLAAKETKLYDALGVPPDADDTLIKKAYRKAALWVLNCQVPPFGCSISFHARSVRFFSIQSHQLTPSPCYICKIL